jgi:hypothetical protein
VLADGAIAIAQGIPIRKSVSMKDYEAMMNALPSLGEDSEAYAHDVEPARSSFEEDADP